MKIVLHNKNGEKELVNWNHVVRVYPENQSRVFKSKIIFANVDRAFQDSMFKESTDEIDLLLEGKDEPRTKTESTKTRSTGEKTQTV